MILDKQKRAYIVKKEDILFLDKVSLMTSLSKKQILDNEAAGTFPTKFTIDSQLFGWRKSDIFKWMNRRGP